MLLQPSLLLLLAEGDCHGYDLYDRLEQFGFEQDCLDSSIVYRHLREMEEGQLITSFWDENSKGPRKRVYQISNQGLQELSSWMALLDRHQGRINVIAERYQKIKHKD
jgi:poly-beta-hydroxybutyrate-responsive repressor